jgi:hypothetical protein
MDTGLKPQRFSRKRLALALLLKWEVGLKDNSMHLRNLLKILIGIASTILVSQSASCADFTVQQYAQGDAMPELISLQKDICRSIHTLISENALVERPSTPANLDLMCKTNLAQIGLFSSKDEQGQILGQAINQIFVDLHITMINNRNSPKDPQTLNSAIAQDNDFTTDYMSTKFFQNQGAN